MRSIQNRFNSLNDQRFKFVKFLIDIFLRTIDFQWSKWDCKSFNKWKRIWMIKFEWSFEMILIIHNMILKVRLIKMIKQVKIKQNLILTMISSTYSIMNRMINISMRIQQSSWIYESIKQILRLNHWRSRFRWFGEWVESVIRNWIRLLFIFESLNWHRVVRKSDEHELRIHYATSKTISCPE
jgi:hypothetical protein